MVSGFGIESIEYRKVRGGGAKDVGEFKVRGWRFKVVAGLPVRSFLDLRSFSEVGSGGGLQVADLPTEALAEEGCMLSEMSSLRSVTG